jgi:hypothetical protein
MIVDSALLITGRKTPVVFQPIDQPLYPLAQAVDGPIKGTGPVFILLPRDGDADTVASQVLPNLATAVGLVTHQTPRPAFGTPAPAPFHGPAFHQGFEGHGFVPLARGEDQRHQLAPTFRANMDFRTEAGIYLRRDTLVSVEYSEELNSITSSATYQRTNRHGIVGQKPSDFQCFL